MFGNLIFDTWALLLKTPAICKYSWTGMEVYKILLLGEGGVGKSCILVQFVNGIFIERYDPTIEDSFRKNFETDGIQCMLEISDTASQEEYSDLRDLYLKNCNGFMLIYSIICKSSFEEIRTWREKILRVNNNTHIPMVLIGNKCDMDTFRQVTTVEAQDLAKSFGCSFFEVSAKTALHSQEIFEDLVRQMRPKIVKIDFKALSFRKGECKLL